MSKQINMEHNGVEYTFSEDALNDVELLEMIEEEKYISFTKKLVGAAQYTKFKDAARDDDGRVPADALEEFITKVTEALDAKN